MMKAEHNQQTADGYQGCALGFGPENIGTNICTTSARRDPEAWREEEAPVDSTSSHLRSEAGERPPCRCRDNVYECGAAP